MLPNVRARPASALQDATPQDEEAIRAAVAELGRLAVEGRQLLTASQDATRFPGLYAAVDAAEYHGPRLAPGAAPRTAEQASEAIAQLRQLREQLQSEITRCRAPIATAREEHAQRQSARQKLIAAVVGSVDPALAETLTAARAALQQAEANVTQARARQQAHEQSPPANPADTPKWAAYLGVLRDEVTGYELLAQRARTDAQQAEQRYSAALTAAWEAKEREAAVFAQQVEAEGKAAVEAAKEVLAQAERDLHDRRLLAGERLAEVRAARTM